MSETTPAGDTTSPADTSATAEHADELREHPQDPAEGADEETDERPDVPRVHSEDPAEG